MERKDQPFANPQYSVAMQILISLIHNRNSMNDLLSTLGSYTSRVQTISESIPKIAKPETAPRSESRMPVLISPSEMYTHSLKLVSGLPVSIQKGKIFSLNLRVKNLRECDLDEEVTIKLSAEVYTSEDPPNAISVNTKGKPIVQADADTDYIQYQPRKLCHMGVLRVRVNESTEALPNGWVFLVIKPTVDLLSVKPLVIPKLRIKAKSILKTEEANPIQ